MKKLLMIAAVMTFLCGIRISSQAGDMFSGPANRTSNPITADYGGVDKWLTNPSYLAISTVGIPLDSALIGNMPGTYGNMASTSIPNNTTQWRVYGAYFSTGTCSADYIEVLSSTGGYAATTSSYSLLNSMRFYNVSNSSSAAAGGPAICSGFNWVQWPIRFKGNLFMRASNLSGLQNQGILYYKESQ